MDIRDGLTNNETAGAARTRPCLLLLGGRGRQMQMQTSGVSRRGNAKLYPPSLRAKRSNPSTSALSYGLLRRIRSSQ